MFHPLSNKENSQQEKKYKQKSAQKMLDLIIRNKIKKSLNE